MKSVPLSKGLYALVDDEDAERVLAFNWFADGHSGIMYAKTRLPGSRARVFLHRFLLNPPPEMVVDHIDGNGLNNTRSNLRICTPLQNHWNRKPRAGSACGLIGVSLVPGRAKPYRARLRSLGACFELGYYQTAEEAARAYDAFAVEKLGGFSRLNFPGAK